MNRIAIVSNRLPPLDREMATAGGLAVGLSAALAESGGAWLGWDGTVAAAPDGRPQVRQSDPFTVLCLTLSEAEHAGYYVGFANRTLWPLLHGRTDLVRFDPSAFETYRAVNARFARRLADNGAPSDAIWVHDYHFFCLGEELRRLGVDLPIGFFLHVPFPSPDALSALPCHRALLGALSAYDLVGFQTENDLRNCREYAMRHLRATVSSDGAVTAPGWRIRTGVFPIGIDTQSFAALAASEQVRCLGQRMGGCFRDRLGMIGVDRLYYTNGLEPRLRAFERMLLRDPLRRQRAFLLQIAAPSREEVPEYLLLRDELEALTGRINARHATVDWTPVRYINRTFNQVRLAALYRLSRVGLVTPIRDGMNMVAKEYVAAQSPDDPGVLVLSRFAGAAERLTGALLVNPFDVDGMAAAMGQALDMSRDERHARWSEMIVELRAHDVHAWREDFLHSLFEARSHRPISRRREFGLGAPPRRASRSDGAQGSRDRIIESGWDPALASGVRERGAERTTACAREP